MRSLYHAFPLLACFILLVTTGFTSDVRVWTVYGDDGRLDVYDVQDARVRALVTATAAMISKDKLVEVGEGSVTLKTVHFGSTYTLCHTERFWDQPSAAECTGFLVAPDLMVTAGHCVEGLFNYAFVFDFYMKDVDDPVQSFGPNQIYYANKVVSSQFTPTTDYAVVQLDRPVVGRIPLTLRKSGKVAVDDELFVIGHPTGLPTKVGTGGKVRSVLDTDQYFITSLDTFGGNSGSPVFNARTLEVEGILVRGGTDYEWDYTKSCAKTFICKENECRGEDVTMISLVLPFVGN